MPRVTGAKTRQAILVLDAIADPNDLPERLALFDQNGDPIYLSGAVGIPPGGNPNQLLTKISTDDFDALWVDPPVIDPGQPGHIIKDETASLPDRHAIDFVGAGVTATDDAAGDRTIVTVPGGISERMLLQRVTSFAVTNDGFPYITWDGEIDDPGGWHAANSTDFSVATTGIYLVTVSLFWGLSPTGYRFFRLERVLNGSSLFQQAVPGITVGSTPGFQGMSGAWIGKITGGVPHRLRVNQNSGGSLNVQGNGLDDGRNASTLSVVRLI